MARHDRILKSLGWQAAKEHPVQGGGGGTCTGVREGGI